MFLIDEDSGTMEAVINFSAVFSTDYLANYATGHRDRLY
jgi:hypothetical protein